MTEFGLTGYTFVAEEKKYPSVGGCDDLVTGLGRYSTSE